MTKRYTLQQYLEIPGNTQTGLAKAVGVTQGAITQMVQSGRSIFVILHDDGSVTLEEIRRLGKEVPPGKKLPALPESGEIPAVRKTAEA